MGYTSSQESSQSYFIKVLATISSLLFISLTGIANAQEYAPGEVIVKLKNEASGQSVGQFFGKASSEKEMTLKGSFGKMNIHQFALKAGQSVEETVAALKQDPAVEYAEPNYLYRKESLNDSNQAYSAEEIHALAGSSGGLGMFGPLSSCVSETYDGRQRPIVAVIDSGLDMTHPVFVNSDGIWTNSDEVAGNGVDDDNNGYADDVHGWNFVSNTGNIIDDDDHGTHVSGIVLSVCHDIYSASAGTSKVQVMPLKFLDGYGVGKTSDAIKAIYYAINNGAKVLNNSWGGASYSGALHEAVSYAYDREVTFIAAAGNNSVNNDVTPIYPSSYSTPAMISVAAVTSSNSLAWFSNYGAGSVHLGGAGVSIYSTIPVAGSIKYGTMSGTSMATPYVAGTAAMMLYNAPSMGGYQVKSIIMEEADVVTPLNGMVTSSAKLDGSHPITRSKTEAVWSDQPNYSFSNQDRALASSLAGGCGLVTKMVKDFSDTQRPSGGNGSGGAPSTWYVIILFAVMALPFGVFQVLKNYKPEQRRKHDRYNIDSTVTVNIGGQKLIANISTISMGGVQLNTEAMLENGGVVAMSIRSPDGKEQIQVEGRVVWSAERKSYGIQFADAKQGALDAISGWTKNLVKQQY